MRGMFTKDKMSRDRVHTVEQLGARQSLTAEGFLLCEAVPIARTGVLLYGPGETPIEEGRDRLVRVERTPDEVFRADTLASFEGKPVTNDHPPVEVNPGNYREYTVGVVQNVRRGTGIDDDLILADLLIQEQEAIDDVRDGKREVSCGYNADYEQFEPGRGRQVNIMGNHVALVERGRCGTRCAIQDEDRSESMSKKTLTERLMEAFKSKDEAAFSAAVKDAEAGEGTAIHIHTGAATQDAKVKTVDEQLTEMRSTIDKLAKAVDKLAKDEDEEEKKDKETLDEDEEEKEMTEDAARAMFQDTAARTELLVPGLKLPTFDAKRKKVKDTICGCQRAALQAAYATADGKKLLEPFLAGRAVNRLTADAVGLVFHLASEAVRAANNAQGVRTGITTKDFGRAPPSISEINKRNAAFWDRQRV